MSDEKKKDSLTKVILIASLICIVVVVGGILISYSVACKLAGPDDDIMNVRGLFGDSWGGVNALVSALAFACVIVTLYLQNRDLNLQREEMQLQRKEFEEENKTIRYQRFENQFYNMLDLQQTIVAGLRYEYFDIEYVTVALEGGGAQTDKRFIKREIVGRDVFRYLFEDVELVLKDVTGRDKTNGYRRFLYHNGLKNYDATLIPTYFDHYFRHLYKMVQYVDSQDFEFDEKYRYVSFLRGTLSRYEIVWLYYNALHPDFYKFKLLIEKYSILKALRRDLLTVTKETIIYYNGLRATKDELEAMGFMVSDFEFYLTDRPEEEGKYQISAFWNKNNRQDGKNHLDGWRKFIDEKAGAVIKTVDET